MSHPANTAGTPEDPQWDPHAALGSAIKTAPDGSPMVQIQGQHPLLLSPVAINVPMPQLLAFVGYLLIGQAQSAGGVVPAAAVPPGPALVRN